MKQHAYPTEAVIEQRASEFHTRVRGLWNLRTTSSDHRAGVADQRCAPPTEITIRSPRSHTYSTAPSDLRFA